LCALITVSWRRQASILADGIPSIAAKLLKSDDRDTAVSAALLIAALCRLGEAATVAVSVDTTALLALIRMLQDGSSLEARAAAGCAIEQLVKGDASTSSVMW